MDIIISGAGIAGLTLSFLLRSGGHELTVVEKSPSLRDVGYMIDFFGSGYDASARMGILSDLEMLHYPIPRLVFVDMEGRERFSLTYANFRRLFDNRHFNFMRGDLERVLYSKVKDHVRFQFATTVESFQQDGAHVDVRLSDGTSNSVDLLIGADGVHSGVRRLAFGAEERFSRFMGYYTAAFVVGDPPRSLHPVDALYTLTVPGRQVAIYPIRDGRLATFFIYKAHRPLDNLSSEAALRELRAVFGEMGWIVPELLDRCDPCGMYFDAVSQVEMQRWSSGRVVLVGDACQCVSLLAGQGASLAMAGAYVLAEELARAASDVPAALISYERKIRPGIARKQEAGRRLAHWFVPDNRAQRVLRDLVTRSLAWPVAWRVLKWMLAPKSIIEP